MADLLANGFAAEDDLDAMSANRPTAEYALTSLSYSSRAIEAPSEAGMQRLLSHARARNRSLGITGMLLFKDGRFYQWLEGPSTGVSEVWQSIRSDSRHAEIELLSEQSVPARLFGDWDMQWFHRKERLKQTQGASGEQARDRNASRLARLAIEGDRPAMEEMITDLIPQDDDIKLLFGSLFEPTERLLGDWWRDDKCTDFDVTLALGALQMMVRRVIRVTAPNFKAAARKVLVAPQPVEAHILGTILVSDCFWSAGWRVKVEFPKSDRELSEIMQGAWFDALNLSLSDVYRREDSFPKMAATIRTVREASRNPNLVIAVSGRAFTEQTQIAAALVGADIGYASSLDAVAETDYAVYRQIANTAHRPVAPSALAETPPVTSLLANLPPGWRLVH